jgi:ferredoxin
MRVVIDGERCTGHGRCYSLAPEVFDADDEGRGLVPLAEVPTSLRERAQIGVDNCPEGAISIVDD